MQMKYLFRNSNKKFVFTSFRANAPNTAIQVNILTDSDEIHQSVATMRIHDVIEFDTPNTQVGLYLQTSNYTGHRINRNTPLAKYHLIIITYSSTTRTAFGVITYATQLNRLAIELAKTNKTKIEERISVQSSTFDGFCRFILLCDQFRGD